MADSLSPRALTHTFREQATRLKIWEMRLSPLATKMTLVACAPSHVYAIVNMFGEGRVRPTSRLDRIARGKESLWGFGKREYSLWPETISGGRV